MSERCTILVIEDDKYIANFLAVSLQKHGYSVLVADTAASGLFYYTSHHPDIILLDLGLPDRDGLEIISELRQHDTLPILVVSARGQEFEKIEALDLGADDYITKPFHMGELLARVRVAERSLLTRSSPQPASPIYRNRCLTVDFDRHVVQIDDQDVHLTPIEFKLLQLLIKHEGKVLTHRFILREVWGYESSDTSNVRVFMASLRRKIEKNSASPQLIVTEVGVGYRLTDSEPV